MASEALIEQMTLAFAQALRQSLRTVADIHSAGFELSVKDVIVNTMFELHTTTAAGEPVPTAEYSHLVQISLPQQVAAHTFDPAVLHCAEVLIRTSMIGDDKCQSIVRGLEVLYTITGIWEKCASLTTEECRALSPSHNLIHPTQYNSFALLQLITTYLHRLNHHDQFCLYEVINSVYNSERWMDIADSDRDEGDFKFSMALWVLKTSPF